MTTHEAGWNGLDEPVPTESLTSVEWNFIMNAKLATALIAIVASTASVSSFAGSNEQAPDSYTYAQTGTSVRSRADVVNEYLQARNQGQTANAESYTYAKNNTATGTSRAEVRLETAKAVRAGTVHFGENM